jgi:hypothetical protein
MVDNWYVSAPVFAPFPCGKSFRRGFAGLPVKGERIATARPGRKRRVADGGFFEESFSSIGTFQLWAGHWKADRPPANIKQRTADIEFWFVPPGETPGRAQLDTIARERRLQPAEALFLPCCRVNAAFLSEALFQAGGGVKLRPARATVRR